MKTIELIVVLAISFVLALGSSMACDTGDFTFVEHYTRPSTVSGSAVFTYDNSGTVSGHNQLALTEHATLGGFDSLTSVETMPCVQGFAPLSETSQTATMNSMKGGIPTDPYFYSHIDSWITVGAATIPGSIPTDPTTIDPVDRYDTMGYNIHGFYNAGDATDSNGVVTTNLRGIETILKSAQDDNIFIQTGSNPGYDYPVLSDFATATVHGMPGESQKFRDLFFSSSNTWDLKSYDWNNNLNIVYKEPSIEFNYL